MAAVAVFMMIMVAFAPMASIFTDDQGSDAANYDDGTNFTVTFKDKGGAPISGITTTASIVITADDSAVAGVTVTPSGASSAAGVITYTLAVGSTPITASHSIKLAVTEGKGYSFAASELKQAIVIATNEFDADANEYTHIGRVIAANTTAAPLAGAVVAYTGATPAVATSTTNSNGEYTIISSTDVSLTANGTTLSGYTFTYSAVEIDADDNYRYEADTNFTAKAAMKLAATEVLVTGSVTDKNSANPGLFAGATVNLSVPEGSGASLPPTAEVADNGTYSFIMKLDTSASASTMNVVTATIANAVGYTFGNVTTTVAVGTTTMTTLAANEGTVTVTFVDAGSATVSDASASAYLEVATAFGAGALPTINGSDKSSTVSGAGIGKTSSPVQAFNNNGVVYYTISGDAITGVADIKATASSTLYTFVDKTVTGVFASAAPAAGKTIGFTADECTANVTVSMTNTVKGNPITVTLKADGKVIESGATTGNSGTAVLTFYDIIVKKYTVITAEAIDSKDDTSFISGSAKITANSATISLAGTSSLITITGLVEDLSSVKVAGAVVSYTYESALETAAENGTVKSGADGSYVISVKRNSTVSITGIVAAGYTFAQQTVNLGKVTGNVTTTDFAQLAFKANEKSTSVALDFLATNGVTGKTLLDGTSVNAVWYEEGTSKKTSVTPKYTYSAASTGTVGIISVSDNGIVKLSYTNPTVPTATDDYSYKCFLLVNGQDNGAFTFDSTTPESGADKFAPATGTVIWKDASTVGTTSLGTIKTNEAVTGVTVKDASSPANELSGMTVSANWYTGTIKSKHTYVSDGATVTVVADSAGKSYLVYSIAKNEGDATNYYMLQVSATDGKGYTFDVSWEGDETTVLKHGKGINNSVDISIAKNAKLTSAVTAIELVSKEASKLISGAVSNNGVAIVGAAINYTTSNGNGIAYTATGGAYSILVASGTSVSNIAVDTTTAKFISGTTEYANPALNFTFSPVVYNLGVVVDAKPGCNFKATTATQSVVVSVTGLSTSDNVPVTLSYTDAKATGEVSGTITQLSKKAAAMAFTINDVPTSSTLTFTLTVDGYLVPSASTGTSFALAKYLALPIVTYNSGIATPAALSYKIAADADTKELYDGYVTTDADGKATVAVPSGYEILFFENGSAIGTGVVITSTDTMYLAVSGISSATVTVTVNYVGSYYGTDSNIVIKSATNTVVDGKSIVLTAPKFDGYKFVGFFVGGVQVGTEQTYTYTADSMAIGSNVIDVVYSANAPSTSSGIDSTTLIIGIVAVVLALVGVALVFINKKN